MKRSKSPLLMGKTPKMFKKTVMTMRVDSKGLDNLQTWQNKKNIEYDQTAFESDVMDMHKMPMKMDL